MKIQVYQTIVEAFRHGDLEAKDTINFLNESDRDVYFDAILSDYKNNPHIVEYEPRHFEAGMWAYSISKNSEVLKIVESAELREDGLVMLNY